MEKEWLKAQVESGRADKDIAADLGLTVHAVGYWRRSFGIPPRPASERVKGGIRDRWPNGRNGSEAANWKGGRRSVRQVCLLLNVPATRLIFSPEEAEDVADKLRYYAKAARGEKPS